MDLQKAIYNDLETSEFGCILANTNPEKYGLFVDNLILPKNKRKNDISSDVIINNFLSVFNDFNYFINMIQYEDEEEKEILLEKPMYFINILGLNDFSFTKKKVNLNNKKIDDYSKIITESFQRNFNIPSTEYIDRETKQKTIKTILNCLYIENKNNNKKQSLFHIDNVYDFHQKYIPEIFMDWYVSYKPYESYTQLKYIIKCDTITKNFLFVVGVDGDNVFDNFQQHFEYVKNNIKHFHSLVEIFKNLPDKQKNIFLDIKNLNLNDSQFIDETIYNGDKYYFCKYKPILNNNTSIPMTNSVKCLSNIIYYHRNMIRNIYFIVIFTKYLEHLLKYFYKSVKIYNVHHLDKIDEIDLQDLYENYYAKLFNYIHNLFLYEKTIFNYDKKIKEVLENIFNKYNNII